jgi:hypothetical protein
MLRRENFSLVASDLFQGQTLRVDGVGTCRLAIDPGVGAASLGSVPQGLVAGLGGSQLLDGGWEVGGLIALQDDNARSKIRLELTGGFYDMQHSVDSFVVTGTQAYASAYSIPGLPIDKEKGDGYQPPFPLSDIFTDV